MDRAAYTSRDLAERWACTELHFRNLINCGKLQFFRTRRKAGIRREIEARQAEADRLRRHAVERAQINAHLAQCRFMLVDPAKHLVANTLEREWNDKLRALANAQEERERGRREDQFALDEAIHDRLIAMTSDFAALWSDRSLPNRERTRLLAYLIEDVTLVKLAIEGTTKIHSNSRTFRKAIARWNFAQCSERFL